MKVGINWTIYNFRLKTKKGLEIKSLLQEVYIIRHEVAEYHQCRALYIIIMEFQYTLKREDIQKGAIFSLFLMICTQTSCVIICHYSVMDKKMTAILYQNHSHFLVGRGGFEPPKSLTTDLQSVPFGRSGTFPNINMF